MEWQSVRVKVREVIKECLRPSGSFIVHEHTRFNSPGWHRVRALTLLLLGSFFAALAINMMYLPFEFTMGGLSGIAAIVYYLTAGLTPFGLLSFLLNIPLLILGLREIGYRFIWKSLVGTVAFSVLIDLTAPLMRQWLQAIHQPLASGSYPDPLIYAIVGGIVFGIGLGLIFLGGYTTGGTDILAVFISRKFPNLSLGQIILILDVAIIGGTLFIPHNDLHANPFLLAMYSFVSLFISTKVIDLVISGLDFSRTAYIISEQADEIGQAIMTELERGVTALQGQGLYTKQDKQVLLCVLSIRQVAKLKELVSSIDSQAFVILSEASEVYGEGFKGDKSLF